MRGLVLPAIRDFNRHRGSFIFFGVLFGFLNSLVLAPAFALVFTLMVRWGGGLVVTNEEIFDFFVSPIGVGATLVLIAAAMTTTLTQQAGLIIVFANLRANRPIGWLRALLATLSELPGILLINAIRAALLLAVLLPFAGLGAGVYYGYLARYDLNYLVTVRPAAFWWASLLAALLVAGAGLCLLIVHTRVIFAFPAYFFGRLSPIGALRQSFSLARGYTPRLVWIFIVWVVLVGALNAILGALLDRLGPLVLPLAGHELTVVVAVVGAVLVVEAIARALLNVFNFGVKAIAVTRAYAFLSDNAALSIPVETRSEDPYSRRTKWVIAALAAVYLGGVYVAASELFEGLEFEDEVTIVAHRGDSKGAPENTLAAIDRAEENGADYAEIDVQETADGVVVVFHDTDLRRIAGLDEKIWDVTYDEIRELDAGSWFSPEFADERIPTLAAAIKLADRRIPLVIELKMTEHAQHLVESVERIIEETGFESQCIVASLSRQALDEVRERNPRLKTGILVFQTLGDIQRIEADYLMVEAGLATPLAVKAAHDAGKQIYVWTVNNPTRMSFLIDRGVDGIMTDDPATLVELLEQRAELSDLERLVLRFAELVSR